MLHRQCGPGYELFEVGAFTAFFGMDRYKRSDSTLEGHSFNSIQLHSLVQPTNKPQPTITMFKSIIAFAALASVAVASPMPAGSGVAGQLEKKDSKWGTGTWYTQNGNPGNCGWYKK